MSGFSNTGNWVDLNIGSSTAVVSKTSTGTIVTLKIGALHKKAQFTDSSHVFPARTTVCKSSLGEIRNHEDAENYHSVKGKLQL